MATIDPKQLYSSLLDQIKGSRLNGYVPKDGERFGIKTGAPDEWARLFTMLGKQESGLRQAAVNADGTLAKFGSTPAGEKSFGPYQFNVGEYGLNTWADVNDPVKAGGAVIKVAEQNVIPSGYLSDPNGNKGMDAYFGPFRRPNEVLQWGGWADAAGLGGNRGGSMNGGYGMSPTGAAGVAGSVQTSEAGHDIPSNFLDMRAPVSSPDAAGPGSSPDFKPDFNSSDLAGAFNQFGEKVQKLLKAATPAPPSINLVKPAGPRIDLNAIIQVLARRQRKGNGNMGGGDYGIG